MKREDIKHELSDEDTDENDDQKEYLKKVDDEKLYKPENFSSCGKDIDLKAIESEMKGLDRPVKKEEDYSSVIAGNVPAHAYDGPRLQRLNLERKQQVPDVHTNKKLGESPNKKPEPGRICRTPDRGGSDPNKSMYDGFEDDIYEFREPEPFEIGEMRSRKEGRGSRGSMASPQDESSDSEPRSGKKRSRVKREGDSDTSETEADPSVTPKKMNCNKEPGSSKDASPNKRDFRLTPIKNELDAEGFSVKDPSSAPSVSEIYSDNSSVPPTAPSVTNNNPPQNSLVSLVGGSTVLTVPIINPGALIRGSLQGSILPIVGPLSQVKSQLICQQRKETILPKSMQPLNPTDIKVVKLDMSAAGSPLSKLSQGEVVGKVTSIVRPKLDLNAGANVSLNLVAAGRLLGNSGSGSHIMAQVLPPKHSRALAKSCSKDTMPVKTAGLVTSVVSPSDSPATNRLQKHSPNFATTGNCNTTVPVSTPIENTINSPSPLKSVTEDKSTCGDPKVIPFIKRQQHIFPHLLNRPGGTHSDQLTDSLPCATGAAAHNQIPLPNTSSSPTNLQTGNNTVGASSPRTAYQDRKSSPLHQCQVPHSPLAASVDKESSCTNNNEPSNDKIVSSPSQQSSVGESIESVIQKARRKHDTSASQESPDESHENILDSYSSPNKKKLGRGKKKEEHENSGADTEAKSKNDFDKRNKRLKTDTCTVAKSPKRDFSTKRKISERNEDDRGELNDADCETCSIYGDGNIKTLDDSVSSPARSLRKKNRGSLMPKRVEVPQITPETDEECASVEKDNTLLSADEDFDANETGLGELLCEETIPPGSPMASDQMIGEIDLAMVQSVTEEQQYSQTPGPVGYTKRQQTLHAQLSPLMTGSSALLARADSFVRHGLQSAQGYSQLHHHHFNNQAIMQTGGGLSARWNNSYQSSSPTNVSNRGSEQHLQPHSPSQLSPPNHERGHANHPRSISGSTIFASQSNNLISNSAFNAKNRLLPNSINPNNGGILGSRVDNPVSFGLLYSSDSSRGVVTAAAGGGGGSGSGDSATTAVGSGSDANTTATATTSKPTTNSNSGGAGASASSCRSGSSSTVSGSNGNRTGVKVGTSSGRKMGSGSSGPNRGGIDPRSGLLDNSPPTTPDSLSSAITDSPAR